MIELDDVAKTFPPAPGRSARPVPALRDVSLAVRAGTITAVVGPNGAGKTTLFALILGFLHPTAGRVRIAGPEPRRYLRRRGAAYLPERFRLPPEWSPAAALRALARLDGLPRDAARARTAVLIDRFDLGSHADRPLGTLSRGLLQRVGLAQALLARRDLVVLDEPTEGLDPLWRIRFRDLIRELRDDGRTLLLASHDLAEVERSAERVVLLEHGRVRDIFDTRPDGDDARAYRLVLAAPCDAVATVFPGATRADDHETVGPHDGTSGTTGTAEATGYATAGHAILDGSGGAAYLVTAADAAELSARLAALIAAGGVVASVTPAAERLEDRVRRTLEAGGAP